MHYDPETNLISWEISKGKISYGKEFGNIIVHFSRNGRPLLIEILNASNIAKQFGFDEKNIEQLKPTEIVNMLGFSKINN